ncbi:TrmH family RNA methyltransferase [Pareuzebyella sediminis]|uniref:TrmH family RNA methyltransferase n=1 Tax=Pareuzebyella sediminis TaxID=2607998 RepID=UPI0011EBC1D6|nr:RNA methyltransferase [Pareuzebyella sediminis]
MHEVKQISSVQNALIKKIQLLSEKSRERRKLGRFVFEGYRELQLAIKGEYLIETVLFEPDIISEQKVLQLLEIEAKSSRTEIIAVSNEVYKKLAYRKTTEGLIAIAESKTHDLNELNLPSEKPLILVAEAPEKPGNIGALLRTADAANLDAVIIANPRTDMYNPNIIRSSVGCLFTNRIGVGSTAEVIAFLKTHHIQTYCAALSSSTNYTEINFEKGSAIVVGTESVGLSEDWLQNSDQNIKIPMQGQIDSMNVSVSAAILIFEAKRQRNFK